MGTAAQRAKQGSTGVGNASPPEPEEQTEAVASPEDLLKRIFQDLPEEVQAGGAVPEVVRKNRRERAKRHLLDALGTRGPYPVPDTLREELRALAARWAEKGFADGFPDAIEFEIRCAEQGAILKAKQEGNDEKLYQLQEQFYRRRVEKTYRRIELRGLNLSERVWQDLKTTYVPLYIEYSSKISSVRAAASKQEQHRAELNRGEMLDVKDMAAKQETVHAAASKQGGAALNLGEMLDVKDMAEMQEHPRVPVSRVLRTHPRLLIVGEPGSGKSTLVAYLATRAAWKNAATAAVPFVVQVRLLETVIKTPEDLAKAVGAEPWFVEQALRRRRALLLIDGLDEARTELAGELLPALTALLDVKGGSNKPGMNRALVTTRPSGLLGQDEAAVEGFERTRLVPMTREEVGAFIDQWCLAAELSLNQPRGQAEVAARRAAEDLKARVRDSHAIATLAQTPLLCAVICVVHRFFGQRIPERRVALYEAITNVMLYDWDRAKFPKGAAIGALDALQKRQLLKHIAFWMHKGHMVAAPQVELTALFKRTLLNLMPRSALGEGKETAKEILAQIRDRNGVLVERSPGWFAFSHLTFQEYLTAIHLVNEQAYERLVVYHADRWWHEVIVLAAGFPETDAKKLLRGLLDTKSDEGRMLAAQCLETAIAVPPSLRSEIEEWVATRVPPETPTVFSRLADIRDVAGPVLLRMLDKVSVEGKATILLWFGYTRYEPAASAIGRLLGDPHKICKPVPATRTGWLYGATLAECAAIVVVSMSETSEAAFSIFLEAMLGAHESAVAYLRMHAGLAKEEHKRARIDVLIARYEIAHASVASSASHPPRRAGRSG